MNPPSKPVIISLLAVVLFALILWWTNPSSEAHAKKTSDAYAKKIGVGELSGMFLSVVHPPGTKVKYNNYWFFSNVSITPSEGKPRTASFGMLGFVEVFE